MTDTSKASPRPWNFHEESGTVVDANGRLVLSNDDWRDAARAVNAHDDLVAALEAIRVYLRCAARSDDKAKIFIERASSALAKARGDQ